MCLWLQVKPAEGMMMRSIYGTHETRSKDSASSSELAGLNLTGPEDIHRVFCYVKTMPWWVACFREQRPGSSVKTSSVEVPAGDQHEL